MKAFFCRALVLAGAIAIAPESVLAQSAGQRVPITAAEGMRICVRQGEWEKAKAFATIDLWEDLKIPLASRPGKGENVVLELVLPEEQRWGEGAFLDYVDFFHEPSRGGGEKG